MEIEEIDFDVDSFADIIAKDDRYDARAYALLADVAHRLESDGAVSGPGFADEFRETALDQYGPLAHTVLREWGVRTCADLGEMLVNMTESGRLHGFEDLTPDEFEGLYDLEDSLKGPYGT
jgi:uncharacterized repeat protein (TIGR04138 family)